jgi:RNA polymerase sigma-70 factor (ECF subfamily)
MHDDDRELVERIQRGDSESFGVLYDRTRGWLLDCVITPRVGRADAEDVLAETFSTALAKISGFRWRGISLLHWLAAIARKKASVRLRRRGAARRREDDPELLLLLRDDAPTAEAELMRREAVAALQERVVTTLAALHPRYAEALRLRLLDGHARDDCASRLGVTTATFDVVLYRAARAFARAWGRP